MTHEIERLRINGKVEGRDHNGKDESVEQRRSEVAKLPVSAEVKVRALKMIRCHREAEQRNKTVSCNRWDAPCGYQRCECDLAREDRAEKKSTECEHDGDCVPGLAF